MPSFYKFLTIFLIALVGQSCQSAPDTKGAMGNRVLLGHQDLTQQRALNKRNISPTINQESLDELIQGHQAFAFDMYQQLTILEGNLIYSPYSIATSLSMVQAGTEGQTQQQLEQGLHVEGVADLHTTTNWLGLELMGRSGETGMGFNLTVANSLWTQAGFPINQRFIETLTTNYGALPWQVDFAEQPNESRNLINEWIATRTQDAIPELLEADAIQATTRAVIVNTIHFNARWLLPFDPGQTQDASFYLESGQETTVPMMVQSGYGSRFMYFEGEGFVVVELLYEAGLDRDSVASEYQENQLSLVFLVPDAGQFEAFERALGVENYQQAVEQLSPHDFDLLGVPKFDVDSKVSLRPILTALGIIDLFDPGVANFSGMSEFDGLYVDEIWHNGAISIDEYGTEASGATAVSINESAMDPATLIIDRPFIFLIRDISTESILFMGRVLNPNDGVAGQ